jgi:uncharacterized RDD family membrane protein YckC
MDWMLLFAYFCLFRSKKRGIGACAFRFYAFMPCMIDELLEHNET